MVEEREGEDMGPVDWSHPIAKDMPEAWHEAEKNPVAFQFDNGGMSCRPIYKLCMYDGWPYWTPRPAIQFGGTLGPEWTFFDSYGVWPTSVRRAAVPLARDSKEG